MTTQALRFPKDWPKIVKPHFLLGLPFVGAQGPVYRDLYAQLATRSDDCWRQWGEPGRRLNLAHYIAQLLEGECDWPNANLIPEDPFILVAWCHRVYGVVEDVLNEIEEHVGAKKGSVDWNRFEASTVGEVVDCLLRESKTSGA